MTLESSLISINEGHARLLFNDEPLSNPTLRKSSVPFSTVNVECSNSIPFSSPVNPFIFCEMVLLFVTLKCVNSELIPTASTGTLNIHIDLYGLASVGVFTFKSVFEKLTC